MGDCFPARRLGFCIGFAALLGQDRFSSPEGEVVLIPTVDLPGEWQGTVVITAYDEYGNFVNDYTANVVLTQVPGTYDWEAKYEVGVDGGVPYLSWEEGMYTGFQLGTSIQNQPAPPTILLDWQQYSPSFDPNEGVYDNPGSYNPYLEQMARSDGAIFQKASFMAPQAGDRGGDYRYRQGRCPCDPPPAVRTWFGCTAAICSGTTASCAFAGTFTPVCVLSRCGGAGVTCAVKGIFGW